MHRTNGSRTTGAQAGLTSIEHGCFDTSQLQEELARALEDDRKYRRTDEMKKRAIHTAASYDEFKNLVACADLKPVSQRELRDFARSDRSTNLAFKKQTRKTFGKDLSFVNPTTGHWMPPKTSIEFMKHWRRHLKTPEDKYKYLMLMTPSEIGTLFRSDIDADLLVDMVGAVRTANTTPLNDSTTNPADFALELLSALSHINRFSLVLDFLDNNQLEKIRDVFQFIEDGASLQTRPGKEDDLIALKGKYRLE